jgi:hypothetical protein
MLDREPRKRDPNAGREPETVVRPNLRARHGALAALPPRWDVVIPEAARRFPGEPV